jgi:hypothetical protein
MKPGFLKILILGAALSLACTTKVSEWVLLNTLPKDYALIYFHKDQLGENEIRQNSEISKNINKANIQFRSVRKNDIVKPYYALYYNDRLFSKYEEPGNLVNLTYSPLREKIAKELIAGKLCVMLYLKTGIRERDDERIQIVKNTIERSPFGKIISVVELSRNDKNENHFISMLLNVEDDLKYLNEPMLFGIFGRFKALEPLVSKGISEENINLMIDFLTADCSCLIKDDMPGTDILYINSWENPAVALVNKILDENPSLQHN